MTERNPDQAAYWNGDAGAAWVKHQSRLDAVLTPFTRVSLDGMGSIEGLKVLDVGCGCGESALELAARGAQVVGLDISAPMIERAKSRQSPQSSAALEFVCADAEGYGEKASFDRIYSRFGCMFFEQPVAAFAHLRTLLKSDGRMQLMCWQSPKENPWMSVAGRAIAPFLPEQPARDPRAPGPFAFADTAYVAWVLSDAGFVGVDFESVPQWVQVAPSIEEAIAFQLDIGPASRALRAMDGRDAEEALDAIRQALEPFVTDQGVEMQGAVWLIRAAKG